MSVIIDQLPSDMTWERFLREVAPRNMPWGKGFVIRFLSDPDQYNRCYIRELELKQYCFADGVYRYIAYDEPSNVWYWK